MHRTDVDDVRSLREAPQTHKNTQKNECPFGPLSQLESELGKLGFGAAELEEIDRHATDAGINLWAESSKE